jgi:hypothetical protein
MDVLPKIVLGKTTDARKIKESMMLYKSEQKVVCLAKPNLQIVVL